MFSLNRFLDSVRKEKLADSVGHHGKGRRLFEFPLLALKNEEARLLLFFFLKDQSSQELLNSHVLKTNGKSRGDSTIVESDINKWQRISEKDAEHLLPKSRSKKMQVLEKEVKLDKGRSLDQEYDENFLNLHYVKQKKVVVVHIFKQYEAKRSFEGRIRNLNLEFDEQRRTITVLETALRKEQRDHEAAERKVSIVEC